MLSEEEIEKAKSNILRGNDIESACLIMEAVIWDGLVQVGGRVNITKLAMRQILNFIEEYKNKGYLDVVREKVKANNKVNQLEIDKQKLIEKLEKDIVNITKTMQDGKHCDDYSRCRLKAYRTKTKEILEILKGEKG